MQTLNININKARIESFSVELEEEKPVVIATIALMTAGGKRITNYSMSSRHWDDTMKLPLPPEMVQPILQIADVLERLVAERCASTALALQAPAVETERVPGGI